MSDPLGLTAQGVEIIRRKSENKLRQTLARIEELIEQYQVELLVLGFPKHMNNDIGDRAEKSLEFRGDAAEADRAGRSHVGREADHSGGPSGSAGGPGVRGAEKKQYVDELAAVFILQGYLDSLRNSNSAAE